LKTAAARNRAGEKRGAAAQRDVHYGYEPVPVDDQYDRVDVWLAGNIA
jgi:hypothetical protein